MASFTAVGDNVTLNMSHKGDVAAVAISGTYNMTIQLQREIGSPGSGAWLPIEEWSTEDATVAFNYVTKADNEHLRLIVTVDTSGTATATLTDTNDAVLQERFDSVGNLIEKRYQDGSIFYNADGDVILDTRLSEQTIHLGDANATILAANSGKVHTIDNVSADRTFTLPTEKEGLRFKFVAEVGAADGHDWIFATTAIMKGGLLVIDTDAGPAVASAVVADQSDDNALQVNVPQGGTWVEFYCDGTNYIVSGVVLATVVPAFS